MIKRIVKLTDKGSHLRTYRVALYKIADACTGFITFGFDLLYCTKRTEMKWRRNNELKVEDEKERVVDDSPQITKISEYKPNRKM